MPRLLDGVRECPWAADGGACDADMDLRGEFGAAGREALLCVRCMRSGVLLYEVGACRRVEGVRGSAEGWAAADIVGWKLQWPLVSLLIDGYFPGRSAMAVQA